MFKKLIYKDKYDEIIKQFENFVYNDLDIKYSKLDYTGWSLCLSEIEEKDDYSFIKYGNLSYFLEFNLNQNDEKTEKITVYLTDKSADEKYTDDYYILVCSFTDNKLRKEKIVKLNEKEYDKELCKKNDFYIPFMSCDFAYYKNHFLILTRDDMCGYNYLACIGKKAEDVLNEVINNIKNHSKEDISSHFSNQKFIDKIKYERKMQLFKKQDNSVLLKKIYDLICDNDLDELLKYVNPDCRYTSARTYGFLGAKDLKGIFENYKIKEIIESKSNISENTVRIYLKYKDLSETVHNNIFAIEIDFNNTIIYYEEEPVFLYGLEENEN